MPVVKKASRAKAQPLAVNLADFARTHYLHSIFSFQNPHRSPVCLFCLCSYQNDVNIVEKCHEKCITFSASPECVSSVPPQEIRRSLRYVYGLGFDSQNNVEAAQL